MCYTIWVWDFRAVFFLTLCFCEHICALLERLESCSRQTRICTTWPSFLFTCRLLFIISKNKLVVSRNFRIVLSCFYLFIFYVEKFSTWIWRLPYTWSLNSLMRFHMFLFIKTTWRVWICVVTITGFPSWKTPWSVISTNWKKLPKNSR